MLTVGGYANTGISVVQGLLLIPLYLHYIGAHMYGVWLASGGVLGLLSLMNFGVSTMLIQRVAHAYGNRDLGMALKYFSGGLVVYLAICLFFGAIGWGLSYWVPEIFDVETDLSALLIGCFQLAIVGMLLAIINECLRSFGQAVLRPLVSTLSMAAGGAIGIVVTAWMLMHEYGLWAIPAGTVVAESIICLLTLFHSTLLVREFGGTMRVERGVLGEYLRTAPALLMSRVGNTASLQAEPVMITMLISPEVTAAYMVTRKAADMVFQAVSVIFGSVHSSFSHLIGEEQGSAKVADIARKVMFTVFSLSLMGCALYVAENHAFVTLWVGPEMVLEQWVILLVGVGFFIRSIRALYWQMLNGFGDFVFLSKVVLMEGLLKLLFMALLLSLLGIEGVAYAIIVSCLVSLLVFGNRLNTFFPQEVRAGVGRRHMLIATGYFVLAAMAANMWDASASWWQFALQLCSVSGVLLVTYVAANWQSCRRVMGRDVG